VHRSFWIGTVALALGAILTASAGCPATSNTGILPITGVDIDIADLLTGANLACGTGPGEVYKYATIANYAPPDSDGSAPPIGTCGLANLAGGVYDCFSLGTFGNLPLQDGGVVPDGGSVLYTVQIYFFTYDAFIANADAIATAVNPATTSDATRICNLPYSWATSCTAIEEDDIIVNAACRPIVAAAPSKDSGKGDATKDAKPKDVASDTPSEATGETGTDAGTDGTAPDGPADAAGASDAPAG